MRKYVVTGIGTGVGKTVVAAIVTEALHADYWKPIQAGDKDNTDSHTVQSLISNTVTTIHKEAYCLRAPLSPHAAARQEGINISMEQLQCPPTQRALVIEGAGGIMVPLNDNDLLLDAIEQWQAEVLLVSRHYLGSINHTLLTWQALQHRNIPVTGIVFNGTTNSETEHIILRHTGLPCVLHIDDEPRIDRQTITKYSQQLRLV